MAAQDGLSGIKEYGGPGTLFIYAGPMRGITLPLIICLLTFPSLTTARVIEGKVIHIADGDTITVLGSHKEQHRVRIAGIDAPEKGQPFSNASRKRPGEVVGRGALRVRGAGSEGEEGWAMAR